MNATLGKKIAYYRKKCGYTQSSLAKALNVTAQTVSSWERAKSSPDIESLTRLATLFSTSTDELLGLSVNTVKENKKVGLLAGETGVVKSYDKKSVFSTLSNVCWWAYLIFEFLGMAFHVLAKNNLHYLIGSLLILATPLIQVATVMFFVLGKKLKDNILTGLPLWLSVIACEVFRLIILGVQLTETDATVIAETVSFCKTAYYISAVIRFFAFPFAFESKSQSDVNSKRLVRVYFEISFVSFVAGILNYEVSVILSTLAFICLLMAKKDKMVRYYYFSNGKGGYITYRDKEREKKERIEENTYEPEITFDLKRTFKQFINSLSSDYKVQLVAFLASSVIVFFGDVKLVFVTIGFWQVLSIVALIFKKSNKKVKIISIVATSLSIACFIVSAIIYEGNGILTYKLVFLPPLQYGLGFISVILFTWLYNDEGGGKWLKILVTIAVTAFTVWFSINVVIFIIYYRTDMVFNFFYWLVITAAFTIISIIKNAEFEDNSVITNDRVKLV